MNNTLEVLHLNRGGEIKHRTRRKFNVRTLILNKFLHRNGGSETYIFKLGEALEQHGHEVQYFGMEHEGRCVGNRVNAYTSDMDFHGGSKLSKLTYPIKTIYSKEARVQLKFWTTSSRMSVT